MQEIQQECRLRNTIWIGKKNQNFMKKNAKKVDFRNFFDPFRGFTVKTVLGIHDPHISWLLFETKNYKMRGPPAVGFLNSFIEDRLVCNLWLFFYFGVKYKHEKIW